jgi:hypothetical protein
VAGALGRGGAIEFALTAPVALLMAMGLCDLAYQLYMQSVLTGAGAEGRARCHHSKREHFHMDATVLTRAGGEPQCRLCQPAIPRARAMPSSAISRPSPSSTVTATGCAIRRMLHRHQRQWLMGCQSRHHRQWRGQRHGGLYRRRHLSASLPHRLAGLVRAVTISATTILKNQPYTAQQLTTIATICT